MRESKVLPTRSEGNSGRWLQAPSTLACPTDGVDVWRVRLDEPETAVAEASILSPDENARASRFHFEKDRIYFTRCRSALRRLLAGYLSVSAAEICFKYLSGGKPQLAVYQNPGALDFNVSHSGSIALIAVGSGQRIGVDIEKTRLDVDAGALAERFFFGPRARRTSLAARSFESGRFFCLLDAEGSFS